MAKIIQWAGVVLTIIFFQGCKSVSVLKQETGISPEWKSFIAGQQDISAIEMKRAQFVAYLGKDTQKSSANIQIIKDSAIHISLQPFPGIELMKIEFSKTMISVFNKMNNQRYEAGYEELSEMAGLPVGLGTWQSILGYQPLSLIQSPEKISKHRDKESTDFKISGQNWEQTIFTGKNDQYNGFKMEKAGEKISLRTDYTDLRKVEEKNFPFKILMDIQNKNLMLKFEVNLSKVTFNNSPGLRYEDKNKYLLVPISSIIK